VTSTAGLDWKTNLWVTGAQKGTSASITSPVVFKDVNLSVTSLQAEAQDVVFRNTGDARFTVSEVVLAGADSSDFTIETDKCTGVTLSPSSATDPAAGPSSCKITVSFRPTAAGMKSGLLTVISPASGAPHTSSLSGLASNEWMAPRIIDTSVRTSGPSGAAIVRFTGSQDGTFQCRVDRRKFRSCRSPLKLKGLSTGRHTVRIRETNQDGTVGPTETVTFKLPKSSVDSSRDRVK
jgi:hypothetical protein